MKPATKIIPLSLMICWIIVQCNNPQEPPPDLFGFSFISYDTACVTLDSKIKETSGVFKYNGQYWTHNDSGNDAALYQFDPQNGSILKKLPVYQAKNRDWEDITQDSFYIYIGDFGNNLGSRKDLVIYKFDKKYLDSTAVKEVDTIAFKFPDQTEFPHSYNHNFDVESILAMHDSLFIFTKNWANKQCKLYVVPNLSGSYNATYISTFDTKGLITSAAYDPNNQLVVLLGYNYNNYNTPFVWLFSNYQYPNFFSGQKTRFNLNLNRQVEGICYTGNGNYLITSEKGSDRQAATFKVQL